GNTEHAIKNGLRKTFTKKVGQYLGDELIREFNSMTEASKETGIRYDNIRLACKDPNKTVKGYSWKFLDNDKVELLTDEKLTKLKGYPKYSITEDGKVYSHNTKRFMKLQP